MRRFIKTLVTNIKTNICDFVYSIIKSHISGSKINIKTLTYIIPLNKKYNNIDEFLSDDKFKNIIMLEGIHEINKILKYYIKTDYCKHNNHILFSISIIE